MMTDPIADMLTRIRNATRSKHPRVDLPSSKMKIEIARLLKEEGHKVLRVFLRYTSGRRSVITGVKRVSRPGSRRYVGKSRIRSVMGGMGVSILSTPRGLMTGSAARKEGVGGELLCEIW